MPEEILTDNGKVFTNRFGLTPTEVLFGRICRENGILHRLTAPGSPTTTGKIERFHRTLRHEFLDGRRSRPWRGLKENSTSGWGATTRERPHQSLGMATPGERFEAKGDHDSDPRHWT